MSEGLQTQGTFYKQLCMSFQTYGVELEYGKEQCSSKMLKVRRLRVNTDNTNSGNHTVDCVTMHDGDLLQKEFRTIS